ncbi:MAG TPA: AAA family ATPase [Pseudonocardia sp.]
MAEAMFATGTWGQGLVGRDGALTSIAEFPDGPGGAVAIVGPSGTGKSTLLAGAAARARGRTAATTVLRLLGTTPESSAVVSLVGDLVDELAIAHGADRVDLQDRRELLARFAELLAMASPERPIHLFLDAVDQLAAERGAHSLAWLPDPLPPAVHVVFTALPGTSDVVFVDRHVEVLHLPGLSVADGRQLLRRWLSAAGRRLTDDQEAIVIDAFAVHGLPLWLRLAAEQARTWPSNHDPAALPPDLPGLIAQLYRQLARPQERGTAFVGHAVGLLATSGLGLTESELLDVLSHDPQVMDEIRARSHPAWRAELESLPVVVWAQLRSDLQPYLTERSSDGELTISFYHRALTEVALNEATYDKKARHQQLAQMFRRRADPAGHRSWRGASPRALRHLPVHLMASQSWDDAVALLCDVRYLERTATTVDRVVPTEEPGRVPTRHGGARVLRSDIDALVTDPAAALSPEARRTLKAVSRALRLDGDLLARRPELLWQQMANRLWWDDDAPTHALLEREADRRRSVPDEPAWLALRTPGSEQQGLLQVLHAHAFAISCALNSDGTLLVSGGRDSAARLWDVGDGTWLADLPGHHRQVTSCAFGPDPQAIYTADEAGVVRRWQWDGMRATLRAERAVAPDRIRSCAAAAGCLVIAGPSGLQVCSPDDLEPITTLDDAPTQCCAAGRNGALIAAGYADGRVRTWALGVEGTYRPLADRPVAHDNEVYACAVDGDGTALLTGGRDGRVRCWHAELSSRGEPLVPPGFAVEPGVWDCAADHALQVCVTALAGGLLQVWHLPERTTGTFTGHAGDIAAVAVSDGGNVIASAGLDGTVRVWDPTNPPPAEDEPFSAQPHLLSFSADGSHVITVDRNGIVRQKATEGRRGGLTFATCQSWCVDAAITDDHTVLLVVDQIGAVEAWNLRGEPHLLHRLPHDRAAACTFAGDRVAVSAADDGVVAGWDVRTGTRLWTARFRPGVPVLAAGPTGHQMLVGSESGELAILDRFTGHRVHLLRDAGSGVLSCAWTEAGIVAAGTVDGSVLCWRPDGTAFTAWPIGPHRHRDRVLHVAAGPPEYPILSSSADHDIGLWPSDSLTGPRVLSGHEGPVRQVVTGPGRLIVSASDDKTLRVWSSSGTLIALLPIPGDGQLIAVHPDSGLIACGDDGGFTQIVTINRAPVR